jgi:hypothetical protein
MPYSHALRGRHIITSQRHVQSIHYDNLADFMYRVSTVHGTHQYTRDALRRHLAASHVLDKNGTVIQDRLQRWADSRGIKAKLTTDAAAWDRIVEGLSPTYKGPQ